MRVSAFTGSVVFAWVVLGGFAAGCAVGSENQKPNVIVFLADDLGYAEVGMNGCKDIPTPNIDGIAKNGVRFTDGYATHPVCAPSRAALMSGRYQHRFGLEFNPGPERSSPADFGLPRAVPTLAEKLKAAGYSTGMIGKWHLGYNQGLRPHERGFDYHFGFLSGARSYVPNSPRAADPLIRNGVRVSDETEYLTDAFAREACAFLDREKDKPFFLYFASNAVHAPLEAPEKYLARFPHVADPKRRKFAAMLSALDDAVGRVLGTVRELGQEANTLVFFYSDNGGPTLQTSSRNDPLRGYKGQMFEGGIRVPFAMQWKAKVPAGIEYREMVMGFDVHATALAAAGLSVPKDQPLDGVDLVPFLTGERKGLPHDRLFWRAGEQHAVRLGDWKLVKMRNMPAMLFDLKQDVSEAKDLATSEPEKLKELDAAFKAWEQGTESPRWKRQVRRNAEGKAKAGKAKGAKKRAATDDDAKVDQQSSRDKSQPRND